MMVGKTWLLSLLSVASLAAQASGVPEASALTPLVTGDEPVVITQHQIQAGGRTLRYEARVGRVPIRHDESGEIRGQVGYVAYVVKPENNEKPRPLTFVWNGGANSNAVLLHLDFAGPRLLHGDELVDNANTLLTTTDLVFYDPVGTGFSRPGKPEYIKEFLTVLGDFAATTEFIRAYRLRYADYDQPVFLMGESSGTWRSAGVLDTMTKRNDHVTGAIMVSGTGGLTSRLPRAFGQTMYALQRTATAFALGKLDKELMKNREATLKKANDWFWGTYMPALENGVDKLSNTERESIAKNLARFTGLKPEQVDRKTLITLNAAWRAAVFDNDPKKNLNMYDMRRFGPFVKSKSPAIGRYLREELGYRTDLAYTPEESGYMPKPGPDHRDNFTLWTYDHAPGAQEQYLNNLKIGEGPPPAGTWLHDSVAADKTVRVMIATGRYDSLNGCEGNERAVKMLPPDQASRFTMACYEGGHMMYDTPETHAKVSADVAAFIEATVSATQR